MATAVALEGAAMSTTFDATTYAAAQCMDGSFTTTFDKIIDIKPVEGPHWSE